VIRLESLLLVQRRSMSRRGQLYQPGSNGRKCLHHNWTIDHLLQSRNGREGNVTLERVICKLRGERRLESLPVFYFWLGIVLGAEPLEEEGPGRHARADIIRKCLGRVGGGGRIGGHT